MMVAMARLAQLLPSRDNRRVLIALFAYLGLLLPALLPFGPSPTQSLVGGVAPHVHATYVDPNLPHDHGGGTPDRVPADAPFFLSHIAVAALLPELPQLPALVATKTSFVAATAPRRSGTYAPGQPRGPPSQA
jgi:hypothetical protein